MIARLRAAANQVELGSGLCAPLTALQGRRLRPHKPVHPEKRHPKRIPRFRRTRHRFQTLQRHAQASRKRSTRSYRNGRTTHYAYQDLLGERGDGGSVTSFREKRKNQRKADWLFSRKCILVQALRKLYTGSCLASLRRLSRPEPAAFLFACVRGSRKL